MGGGGASGQRSSFSLALPLGGRGSYDNGPTTVESFRVKPRESMATRHWTVIMQGDRIVTVLKDELHQRPLKSPSESSFGL